MNRLSMATDSLRRRYSFDIAGRGLLVEVSVFAAQVAPSSVSCLTYSFIVVSLDVMRRCVPLILREDRRR